MNRFDQKVRRVAASLAYLLLAVALGFGCFLSPGKDDGGGGGGPDTTGNGNEPTRETISSLLEEYFEQVYAEMDSAGYEEALDESYLFETLPIDETNPEVEIWGKLEELEVASRMFSGWENPAGVRVNSIKIEIDLSSASVDATDYPEKPDGEDWFLAQTTVELTVVAQNPNDPDGTGITNYVVNSFQDFVCRPDPDDTDLFVIARQFDRESIAAGKN